MARSKPRHASHRRKQPCRIDRQVAGARRMVGAFWGWPVLLAGVIYAPFLLGAIPSGWYPATALLVFADRVAHVVMLEARLRQGPEAGTEQADTGGLWLEIAELRARDRVLTATMAAMCREAGMAPPPEPPAGPPRLYLVSGKRDAS